MATELFHLGQPQLAFRKLSDESDEDGGVLAGDGDLTDDEELDPDKLEDPSTAKPDFTDPEDGEEEEEAQ